MKNLIKLIGLIALAAVIGFSMTACPADAGGGGEITYKYSDDEGNAYELLITSEGRAAYKPKNGDNYVLTITFKDSKVEKSTGTVKGFKDDQLQLKSSDNKEFQVMVKGDNIAGIAGDDLPVELPAAKRVTITGFINWTGAHSDGGFYPAIGVFLIADTDKLYDGGFPIVDALQYPDVQRNATPAAVPFDLIIPVYNTWNYGRMPWTGTGSYYVVIVPCMPQYQSFYADEAKIYKTGGSPVTVNINSPTTSIAFSNFVDWDKYKY